MASIKTKKPLEPSPIFASSIPLSPSTSGLSRASPNISQNNCSTSGSSPSSSHEFMDFCSSINSSQKPMAWCRLNATYISGVRSSRGIFSSVSFIKQLSRHTWQLDNLGGLLAPFTVVQELQPLLRRCPAMGQVIRLVIDRIHALQGMVEIALTNLVIHPQGR